MTTDVQKPGWSTVLNWKLEDAPLNALHLCLLLGTGRIDVETLPAGERAYTPQTLFSAAHAAALALAQTGDRAPLELMQTVMGDGDIKDSILHSVRNYLRAPDPQKPSRNRKNAARAVQVCFLAFFKCSYNSFVASYNRKDENRRSWIENKIYEWSELERHEKFTPDDRKDALLRFPEFQDAITFWHYHTGLELHVKMPEFIEKWLQFTNTSIDEDMNLFPPQLMGVVRSLKLRSSPHFSNYGWRQWQHFHALESLEITPMSCEELDLSVFENLPSLRHLHINFQSINDECDLSIVNNFPSLASLYLTTEHARFRNIPNFNLKRFSKIYLHDEDNIKVDWQREVDK